MALDRSIDRKVRIILTMRKEHRQPPGEGAGADTPFSICDSGQDGETRPSLRETQTPNGKGLRQPANNGTESQAEENADETSKSPEQSENVIENKGPAAEDGRIL
jgi:hypothetical protein